MIHQVVDKFIVELQVQLDQKGVSLEVSQEARNWLAQLAEREEMVAELSAAKQQITQSEHWRAECELLNNEVRSLQSVRSCFIRSGT